MYRELGLDLCRTDNPLETGVLKVCQRMSAGRLRVFRSLAKYLDERRLYRRDGNKWHREIPQETCEAAASAGASVHGTKLDGLGRLSQKRLRVLSTRNKLRDRI